MNDYITEIDNLFPGWSRIKFSEIRTSKESKITTMIWSFRLEEVSGKISKIHILRNDLEAAQGVDWFKSLVVDESAHMSAAAGCVKAETGVKKSITSVENSFDPTPYFEPKAWILNKNEHATLDDQRAAYFSKAKRICLAKDWVFSNRTELYSKTEDWTTTPTMMDKVVIGARPAAIYLHLTEQRNHKEKKSIFDKHAGKIVTERINSRDTTTSVELAKFVDSTGCRWDLTYRQMPLPWPLSDRDIVFQTAMRVYGEGTSEEHFAAYACSVDILKLPEISGVVRVKDTEACYWCSLAREDDGRQSTSSSIFYYSLNMDFGGIVPAHMSNFAIRTIVKFPRKLRKSIEEELERSRPVASDEDGRRGFGPDSVGELQRENSELRQRLKKETLRNTLGDAEGDFTLADCLVAQFKDRTIEEQRKYFLSELRKMSRSTDGWSFYGTTMAHGVAQKKQLDVYARKVSWSEAMQLRAVLEANFAVDDVFQHLLDTHDDRTNMLVKGASTDIQKNALQQKSFVFPVVRERESATSLIIRELEMPWPLVGDI